MTKNLLPIRILFHSSFALAYLPAMVLAFVLNIADGLQSLSVLGCLGVYAALDILTIRRKVNQIAFMCIDLLVAVSLPVCLLWFISDSINNSLSRNSNTSDTFLPINLAAGAMIVALSMQYVLYIVITALVEKLRGNMFLPVDPDDPLPFSSGTQRTVFFVGRRRTLAERETVSDHCTSYIFQNSVFRKHPFEPTGWAIFRGIIAVYCSVGLGVFAAYIGYSGGVTYANGGAAIQETLLPNATVVSNLGVNPFLSVAVLSPLLQSFPLDFRVSGQNFTDLPFAATGMFRNLTYLSAESNSQYWDCIEPGYPWIEHSDFNVSWSGDVTLDTWATISEGNGTVNSVQAIYSPGFRLLPFKEYVITLTIISYKMNGFSWLFLEPQVQSAGDSGSNTTTARFSCSWQSQRQITHRELTPTSGPAVFAQALSAIGGVYAFIDVVFALIFGRTMLAILFGAKIISPFGLLGIVTRDRFRRLIDEQYPYLRHDIERGGMAAYISEVAIDPGLILASNSASSRIPTSSLGSNTGCDAEEDGLIPLRSMEPSGTSRKSSHSQLQLPYLIEAYEPSSHDNE